jgi:6-phosphofructokinase 1
MLHNKRFGVLTCGGVCPGLNDVVRRITIHSYLRGVPDIYGIPYGFYGLNNKNLSHIPLSPSVVRDIHKRGGTFLGTSRERLDVHRSTETLLRHGYDALFVLGGNGGNAAAHRLYEHVTEQGLPIQVIALPKSIDNDIDKIDKCFGFDTAVHEASKVLEIARNEADAVPKGIVVVKLMGRDSGFIAHNASYANIHDNVDVCLIPERPVSLSDVCERVHDALQSRYSCVVCVAEGFHIPADVLFNYLRDRYRDSYVKYMDPSYMIRGGITTYDDHLFCNLLGIAAVNAALDGLSGVTVATHNGKIKYYPTSEVIQRVRQVQDAV